MREEGQGQEAPNRAEEGQAGYPWAVPARALPLILSFRTFFLACMTESAICLLKAFCSSGDLSAKKGRS